MQSTRSARREGRSETVTPRADLQTIFQDELTALSLNQERDSEYARASGMLSILVYVGESDQRSTEAARLLGEFANGHSQFLQLYAAADDAYQQAALRQLEAEIGSSPDQVPHYTIIRDQNDPSVLVIRNNWFIPFSDQDKETLAGYLSAAQNLGGDAAASFFSLFSALKDLAIKTYALHQSEVLYGTFLGSETVRDVTNELVSSYENMHAKIMQALGAIVSGSPDATSLISEAAPLIEQAKSSYGSAFFQLAEGFNIFDPVSQDPTLSRYIQQIRSSSGAWPEELSFNPVETAVFNSAYDQYVSLLEEVRAARYELAARVLGVPPGEAIPQQGGPAVTISGISSGQEQLFRRFLEATRVLQLFAAKARFLEIYGEYSQYKDFIHLITPPAGILTDSEIRAEAIRHGREDVLHFLANKEKYEGEANDLRRMLVSYGSFMEDFVEDRTPELTTYFSSQEKEAAFEGLRSMRSAISRMDSRQMLMSELMEEGGRYLGSLSSGMTSLYTRSHELEVQNDLYRMCREGNWLDCFYGGSRYVWNQAGTEIMVLATVLGAVLTGGAALAFGPAALGSRLAGAGAWQIAKFGASLGMATATAFMAPSMLTIGAHGIANIGEGGLAGEIAYQDLASATQFFMCGGMAWAGGTGLSSRIFSTASFTAATATDGFRLYEDIARGDPLALVNAVADFGILAFGGYMIYKGIRGIQVARIAEANAVAAGETMVATPFGLRNLQLPKIAEWFSFPYTTRGLSEFYLFGAAIEAATNPDEIADIYARDGITGLRAHFNGVYQSHANMVPMANLVISAGLAAPGAVSRLIRGRPSPTAVTVPAELISAEDAELLGRLGLEGAATLRVSGNPAFIKCAQELGIDVNMLAVAQKYGLDVATDRGLLKELYSLVVSGNRITETEILEALGPNYVSSLGNRANQFARELAKLNNDTVEVISDVLSGSASQSLGRRVTRLISLARQNARELALPMLTLTIGGYGFYEVAGLTEDYSRMEAALYNVQGRIDEAFRAPSDRWFVLQLLGSGHFLGVTRLFTPAMEMEALPPEQPYTSSELEAAFPDFHALHLAVAGVFNDMERGAEEYSEFSATLKQLLPDAQSRFDLVYAAALALLGSKPPGEQLTLEGLAMFRGELGNVVGTLCRFMDTPLDLGTLSSDPAWYDKRLDWTGMGLSDFFMAANYLLDMGKESGGVAHAGMDFERIVTDFASEYHPRVPDFYSDPYLAASAAMSYTREAVEDPQFARVAVASLYASHFLNKGDDWADAALRKLVEAVQSENLSLAGIANWQGELITGMLASEQLSSFSALESLDNETLAKLYNSLLMSDIYPYAVYSGR